MIQKKVHLDSWWDASWRESLVILEGSSIVSRSELVSRRSSAYSGVCADHFLEKEDHLACLISEGVKERQ